MVLLRICLIKTLQEKKSIEKNFNERKRIHNSFICDIICLLKILLEKKFNNEIKTWLRKKVQNTLITSPCKDNYISDKEGQIIFCTSYSKLKSFTYGNSVERSSLSSYASPNYQFLRDYFHTKLLQESLKKTTSFWYIYVNS